jgi:hypothetical protein
LITRRSLHKVALQRWNLSSESIAANRPYAASNATNGCVGNRCDD